MINKNIAHSIFNPPYCCLIIYLSWKPYHIYFLTIKDKRDKLGQGGKRFNMVSATHHIKMVCFGSCHTIEPSSGRLNSNLFNFSTVGTTIRNISISVFVRPTFSNFCHSCSTRTLHNHSPYLSSKSEHAFELLLTSFSLITQ